MKNILFFILLFVAVAANAQINFNTLPSVSTVTPTTPLPTVNTGGNWRKLSADLMRAFIMPRPVTRVSPTNRYVLGYVMGSDSLQYIPGGLMSQLPIGSVTIAAATNSLTLSGLGGLNFNTTSWGSGWVNRLALTRSGSSTLSLLKGGQTISIGADTLTGASMRWNNIGFRAKSDSMFITAERMDSITVGEALVVAAKFSDKAYIKSKAVSGGGGGTPSGAAGGDLTGTYPNPTIGNNKVISAYVLDGTLVNADLASQTIDSNKLKNGAITTVKLATNAVDSTKAANLSPNDLAQTGASTNDVLTWTGSKYAPRPSSGGITALTGDVTASGSGSVAATIANDAITSAKIATGQVGSDELASSGVMAGSYTAANITVDADGRITAAANGSGGGGGGGSPGGSSGQIQYNSSGSFAGESGITRSGTGSIALSGKLVSGDTVSAKTITVRGLLTIGDNFISALDTITFFGNSITQGYWAFPTNPTARWTTQVSYYYGSFEDNKGISNTRMSGGTNAMESRTAEIPNYRATRRYLVFDYGVNDANNAVDTATFKTAFAGVIDAATAKGWPTTRIVIASPTLTGIVSGCIRCRDFVSASKNVALAKSTKYVDMFNGMLTEGGRATIHSDSIHPTVFGHKVAAEVFVNSLNDTDLKGTIRANQAIVEKKLNILGVSDFSARTNFLSDVYFTGEVKSSMNLSAGGFSKIFGEATVDQQKWGFFRSGNNRYGMGVSTSGGIFSDHYFSSAATAYRIGTMSSSDGTTFSPLFRVLANGNGDLTGTLTVGGLSVTNATTFSSGVTITGDAVIAQQRLAVFRSGNFRYGMGMGTPDGSNYFTDIYGSSTGSVRLGSISTTDGTTYSPVISVWANGRTYVGTSPVAPTAILHLKGGTATASTAPLKFTSGTNLTTPEAGAVEYDGTDFYGTNSTASRTIFARVLKGSATLDFPSTSTNSSSDLTITVTGAADGDVVSLGVPNGSAATGLFFAWVSAANTVTVRFHNTSGGSVDPASGTFKVNVSK